jgi:hypothetical protein
MRAQDLRGREETAPSETARCELMRVASDLRP